jgi:hypothetical protein
VCGGGDTILAGDGHGHRRNSSIGYQLLDVCPDSVERVRFGWRWRRLAGNGENGREHKRRNDFFHTSRKVLLLQILFLFDIGDFRDERHRGDHNRNTNASAQHPRLYSEHIRERAGQRQSQR